MAPRYRIAGLTVQPIMVIEDGDDLSMAPEANAVRVSLADLAGCPLHAGLLADLERMNASAPDAATSP